jgi:NTP pyrophosphatase (non-canonical NTP hydrolase)
MHSESVGMTPKNTMDFQELIQRTSKIKGAYAVLNRTEGNKTWGVNEYTQGLVGDVGDLVKLIMAKKGYRFAATDTDKKLANELSDCLWSIIVIADELDIDLEKAFIKTLNQLESKISERKVIKTTKSKTL